MLDPIREGGLDLNGMAMWLCWPFFVAGVVILGLLSVDLFLASITFAYLEMRQEQRQEHAIAEAHRMLVASLLGHTSTNIYDAAALEQNDDEETSHGRHSSFAGKDVNDGTDGHVEFTHVLNLSYLRDFLSISGKATGFCAMWGCPSVV